ncbi:MAG: hypothetical protein IJE08_07130 [Clostridia bacterium]|nr:hypothetical protein [Clostridia bacterium]
MFKKMMILVLSAMLLFAAAAVAEAAPVRLDGTTIIDGDLIYYSGSVDGGESGVFTMNSDGSDVRRISDITADLLALSGENLLVYHYDLETGDGQLAVLFPDGVMAPLGGEYSGTAIAADGRFFWGAASCAEDGSDVQIYLDGGSYYDYYALAVEGGYYYYLDWTEMSGSVYSEGTAQPMGAELCRMNLSSYSCEIISGVGTRFLGIEDGKIYYTRDNFWRSTGDGSEEIAVDEGLFCASADTLEETKLADYSEGDGVVDSYTLVQDGVIYGLHSDYSSETGSGSSIVRVKSDGTRLADLPVDSDAWVALNCVEDNTLYISQCSILSSEDDFIQQDRIIAISLTDDSQTMLNPESLDMLFYTEMDPVVRVVNGRIYFSPYDMERWSVCLKSMNTDGSDLRLLAHGVSFAEG